MLVKLLWIISVDFDVADEVLIRFFLHMSDTGQEMGIQ
jgi:hypothetical protein